MTGNTMITALCAYLRERVAKYIWLEQPQEQIDAPAERAHPAIYEGYIPPKNLLPDEFAVPSITVGIEGGTDNDNDSEITFRLTFAVFAYDGGYGDGDVIDHMQGYTDLIHLLTETKAALAKDVQIGGAFAVKKPIVWKMYEEQPYPYWYATMTFAADAYRNEYENRFL